MSNEFKTFIPISFLKMIYIRDIPAAPNKEFKDAIFANAVPPIPRINKSLYQYKLKA